MAIRSTDLGAWQRAILAAVLAILFALELVGSTAALSDVDAPSPSDNQAQKRAVWDRPAGASHLGGGPNPFVDAPPVGSSGFGAAPGAEASMDPSPRVEELTTGGIAPAAPPDVGLPNPFAALPPPPPPPPPPEPPARPAAPAIGRVDIDAALNGAAAEFGLDPSLLYGLAFVESSFNPAAVSSVGALGLLQVMPATGDWATQTLLAGAGDWRTNPYSNARVGAAVLRDLIDMAAGDVRLALAAYYQGWGAIQQHGWFAETEAYVERVLAAAARY